MGDTGMPSLEAAYRAVVLRVVEGSSAPAPGRRKLKVLLDAYDYRGLEIGRLQEQLAALRLAPAGEVAPGTPDCPVDDPECEGAAQLDPATASHEACEPAPAKNSYVLAADALLDGRPTTGQIVAAMTGGDPL